MYLDHQSNIVSLAYFVESGLVPSAPHSTSSTAWICAFLGTLLCIIPGVVLLRCLHFPLRLKALAFLPSYIILGFITSISPVSVYATENEISLLYPILFLVLSVVLIFFSSLYREDRGEHAPIFNYLGTNVLISCLGMIVCIALTNTDRCLHLQLSLANGMHQNDFSKVKYLNAGETATSNTITSIQALRLSKSGVLADELFSLSHLRGSSSLLPDSTPSSLLFHTPTLVYGHLQAIPLWTNKDATLFLEKAVRRIFSSQCSVSDSIAAKPLVDYYLCALLLDKDLSRFSMELPKYYASHEALPRHYQEAQILCYDLGISSNNRLDQDVKMDSLYNRFKSLRQENSNNLALARKNCFYACPHSYWNYYFFGNNKQ